MVLGSGTIFATSTEGGQVSETTSLRRFLGRDAFLGLVAHVGAWALSVRRWVDQRKRGTTTLHRDFSAGTSAAENELEDVASRWRDAGETPSDIVRETVETMISAGALDSNLNTGPLFDNVSGCSGTPATFLVTCSVAFLVAQVQALIPAPTAMLYYPACYFGVWVVLGVILQFFYYNDDVFPKKNELGLFVLGTLLKAQLAEFMLVVYASYVVMQSRSSHVPDIGKWLPYFQDGGDDCIFGYGKKADDLMKRRAAQTPDGEPDLDLDGPPDVPDVDEDPDETYQYAGPPGRLSKILKSWRGVAENNVQNVESGGREGFGERSDDIFEGSRADADRAHAATLALPSWISVELFGKDALVKKIKEIYDRCARLVEGTALGVDPNRAVRWVFWLRAPRGSVEELPPLCIAYIPKPFQVLFTSSLAYSCAGYMEAMATPVGLLMALAYTMRHTWDSGMPASGLAAGKISKPTFVFHEVAPEDVTWFLRSFYSWLWIWWPALMWGLPFRAALYYADDGSLVPGSGASRRGTTDRELPLFPARVVFYDDSRYAAYVAADTRLGTHVLDIEALRPCLSRREPADLLRDLRAVMKELAEED